ncbi:MAG: sensor histidine kinase [Bacteroidota bacterium]
MLPLAQISGEYLNLLLAGVFGMVMLSIALVLFFVVYQRRLYAQERLRQREEKAHQQQLLAAAVEVQETERRRIARDLHDDIGSLLSATRLYLRQLAPDNPPERLTAIKEESLVILDEMIQNTRRITHDLLPSELEKFGFSAAAEDLCERVDRSGGISVRYQDDSRNERRLHQRQEVALFRVLQELVNNTLKHAEADHVEVLTEWQGETFHFRYQDDGKGFAIPAGGYSGLGLKNIESRVSLIGGKLDFVTAPGKGLRVDIQLPPIASQ